MAKDYTDLAHAVADVVGGKENVVSVTNCMTRLRFVLKDVTVPNEAAVRAIDGVQGVMNQGGQYQIIIGTHVSNVAPLVRAYLGLAEDAKPTVEKVGQDTPWNRFFKTISGCIMPILGPMVGGGIIKGVLALLVTFGLMAKTDGAYQLWYAAADAVLYFMPIVIGFSAGKVFGCNQYVTATIGAAFLYPDLVSAVAAEGGLTFFGLPIASASYSSTLFPILLAALLASYVEKGAKKIVPEMVQLMFVPMITLAVTVPCAWLVIGPVMNVVSGVLSSATAFLFSACPVVAGIVLGAFWQLIVLLGLHAAFVPVLLNNLMTTGSDPMNAVMGVTVWALAGTALGYALKMKDAKKRAEGFSNVATCLCGVTEPTIYSIALPQFKCFVAAMIGGGIGGGVLAALGGRMYAWVGDGLFRIPGMINPAGIDVSLYGFIACAIGAAVISAVISFAVADPRE